jgi:hypothetical protein
MGNWKLRERGILENHGADGRIVLQQTELTLDKARFGESEMKLVFVTSGYFLITSSCLLKSQAVLGYLRPTTTL